MAEGIPPEGSAAEAGQEMETGDRRQERSEPPYVGGYGIRRKGATGGGRRHGDHSGLHGGRARNLRPRAHRGDTPERGARVLASGAALEFALEERKETIGLPKNRADVILMGVAIYQAVMEEFGFRELRISTRGLRFAAVMG